ncbi:hypothetical protein O3P69_020722 [Scylla paramamosain]|uniref:Coiled-coil domain-containing protein 137 n=1 Tax=Scylla paramamosain TaxID=85552 RepID=A0AAW0TND3_SCYPA
MGRKIPRKKHRGVKDPYKQQEERFNKIKNKLNAKPESTESQEIPRRLQNIAKFNSVISRKGLPMKKRKKEKLKNNTLIDGRKYVDREKELPGMTRPTKLVPLLQQHPKETYKKFLKRVDRVTHEIIKEADFEKKFKVEVKRDERGQVVAVQHQEKIDPLLSDKQKEDLVEREEKKKAARRERDKRRRGKKRKNDGDDDDDEFSYYQDKFEFGEVVYEPPSLDTEKLTRKMNRNEEKSRSFLFMEKLKEKQDESSPSNKPSKKAAKIPAGRRRILEEERQRVVEAYRSMKASKHSLTQQSTM